MLRLAPSRVLPVVALLLALAPRALAGHLYVDPVLGSDANPGTSPDLPFKHILKGLQAGGTSNDILHLAPGEYSAASDEHFPLSIGAAWHTRSAENPSVIAAP